MAVTATSKHRILNSTTPFTLSHTEPKGPDQSDHRGPGQGSEDHEGNGGKAPDLMECLNPMLTKVLTQGTAHVGQGPLSCWKVSPFIAQAECETQESQEFSPSCSERSYLRNSSASSEQNNVVVPSLVVPGGPWAPRGPPGPRPPRRRQRRRRRERRREERRREEQRESRTPRQRRRVPSGVPEQESGGSALTQVQEEESEPQRTNNAFPQSPEVQDTGPPRYPPQPYVRGPGGVPLGWGAPACDGGPVGEVGEVGECGSWSSSVGDCTLALAGLRGSVSQGDRCFAGPFSRDLEREVRRAEEEEGEEEEGGGSALESDVNEGLIFSENLTPVDYEYREGKDFSHQHFIKAGSYGEVYRTQDLHTGFSYATKKVPLKVFSSEEVGTWSALSSPRVVELFGVVREGPYILLFMELKSGSVGELLAERGRLPEDLALHYLCQVLSALGHLLKRRVLHLDIKVDNVLLSEDGRDTFLCDFGQSETLDHNGQSVSTSLSLKGTETHMAPEVVAGKPRGARADVWSSCCMLLHMLNGCQPWIRYYSRPLYLKIASEPPPLREIPPDCAPLTAEVIRAGLNKDPIKRDSASDLKTKTTRALREVGGLTSPVRGPHREPLQRADHALGPPLGPPLGPAPLSHAPLSPALGPALSPAQPCVAMPSREQPGLWELSKSPTRRREDDDGEGEEEEEEEEGPGEGEEEGPGDGEEEEEGPGDGEVQTRDALSALSLPTSLQDWTKPHLTSSGPELELRKLEWDFYLSSLSQLHSAEIQEQLLSCLSSECHSSRELDKKDSGRWSISPGDDLSSGVFSYSSQPEQVFSTDWLGQTHLPPPRCFEGVDVCVRDFSGGELRIRETRRVKVGHIASGISDQISERVFTMVTLEGTPVLHDQEVQDSVGLRCVPAPEASPLWTWRIRDGLLETRA